MLRTFRGVLPTVEATAYIDQSAQVIGHVHWIRIGARTTGQQGTIVHAQGGTHSRTIAEYSVNGVGRPEVRRDA